ncbi:MAG: hybrid sensor histidine kinase/response regulator [Myxococcales bacterium]|nr:hybrid sensor histidine kinase/response regulator [Myxococcales bacterium]
MITLDAELLPIFLGEARGYLETLELTSAPMEPRLAAAVGLRSAAELVRLPELVAEAVELERLLRAHEPQLALGALARARTRIDALAAEHAAHAHRIAAAPASASAPFQSAFDADETRMLHELFLAEATEHLEDIAAAITRLGKESGRRAALDELLRKTHTLKGAASTVGFAATAEAAHALEDIFASLRRGKQDASVLDLGALDAAVQTVRAITEVGTQPELTAPLAQRLAIELGAALRRGQVVVSRGDVSPDAEGPQPDGSGTWTGADPGEGARFESQISWAAESSGYARSDSNASWTGSGSEPRATPAGSGEADALFGEHDRGLGTPRRREDLPSLRVDAARIDELMLGAGELLFDRARIERRVRELGGLRDEIVRLGRTLADARAEAGPGVEGDRLATLDESVAAHARELARLIDGLGEDTRELEQTTLRLQDGLQQVRMMSARFLFARLARAIRDVARRSGKQVELVTAGDDTRVDKAVLDRLVDPLVQILRNAIVHGIEAPHLRVRMDKPAAGRINLGARTEGDTVVLEVADDGAGIDVDRLRAALVAGGRLTEAEAAATEDERIVAVIFEPGVTVREHTDELAGRGVGLDVVRQTIARLGGEIDVTSTSGQGTRFTLRVPLSTALTQAVLFKLGGAVYALPAANVAAGAVLPLEQGRLPATMHDAGQPTPILSLHALLGRPAPDGAEVNALVIEFAGRRLAVTCDRVIGPREVVVRSLGPLLAPLALYAGATISGAGKVQLILDPATLCELAHPGASARRGSVRVPDESGPHPAPPALPPPVPRPHSADARRILVVDDSPTVRASMARTLTAAGHTVDLADDGIEASALLAARRYDLLVTDLEMPRRNGWELIAEVRARPDLSELPVVVITSRVDDAARRRALDAGATRLLLKPAAGAAFLAEIAGLLGRSG